MAGSDRRETLISVAEMCRQLGECLTAEEIGKALPVAVSDEGVLSAIAEWSQGFTEELARLFQALVSLDDDQWDRFKRKLEENGKQSP